MVIPTTRWKTWSLLAPIDVSVMVEPSCIRRDARTASRDANGHGSSSPIRCARTGSSAYSNSVHITNVNHQSSASHVSGLIAEVNIYQPDSQSRENFSIDCNCKQIAKRLLSHNRAQGSACKPRRCPGGLKGPPLQPAWTVARTTLGCIPEPGAPSTLPARQLRHRTFRGPLCD